jgi:hypothetical protein
MPSVSAGRTFFGGPRPIGALIGRTIQPVTARRGFATAELVAAWPELIGPAFVTHAQPAKISWPRGAERGAQGTLTIRVTGGRAVYLMHELDTLKERINAFLGFEAIQRIKLIPGQAVSPPSAEERPRPPVNTCLIADVGRLVKDIEDEPLRASLQRLGLAVFGEAGSP